jgi:hypothetical protein
MPVQGSDAALNSYYESSIESGASLDFGLLHVAGMTRLTYHVLSLTDPGVLPPLCVPLVGYRTRPTNTGDQAFSEPAGQGLKIVLPPAMTANGVALFTVNTVAAEVMAIRIYNTDPASAVGVTVILSASA